MGDQQAKNALYDVLVEAAKALGNGRRAQLIEVLGQGERSVEELSGEIHQSTANTSQHLQRLLRAGLASSRRSGTRIYYSLASPAVERLWRALRETAESHTGELGELVRAYVGDRAELSMITRDELLLRLRQGDVVVLDVRPLPEYEAGHIPNAISVPLPEVKSRLREIPKGSEIVAYCRGPYCLYADEAVRLLADEGRVAVRLEEGFPEWKAAGLPIEASAR
ncbi:ArsR family transcriptional regulator [Arthrobacter sp. SLBN-112]|uniref:ArsR/SmtB family transcription factor n=1 Tax=Arthrobacter sp. SLBN-112 TaxID=2768452 RepID=UPI0011504F4D|nr:metalloregulator ArsR/SmtB family transcription factor [Arthrobacter sp. SLBN-112]TQJ40040.1 ArsR family transcriptional regulator [Arthrobacter sp. SLBN-112]